MPGKQTQRGDTARAYSLGFELVCAVAGFVLVGIWIDRHYSSGPWGTLVCLGLGLIGGFYNLIRGASRMSSGFRPGMRGGAASAPEMERQTRAARPQPDDEAGPEVDGGEPKVPGSLQSGESSANRRR